MKVSVIIPVFNTEKYVEQCVRSCMIQEEVGEIIIINDGSTDTSDEIIHSLQQADDRIIILYHENKKNRGAGLSRNIGINKASCELINFLDADDYYHKNRFSNTIEIIKVKRVDGVFETLNVLQESSFPNKYPISEFRMNSNIRTEDSLDAILSGLRGSVQLCGFTFKRSFILNHSIKCLELRRAQELNIIFEACVKGNILLHSGDAVGTYRLHSNNSILNTKQGKKDLVIFYSLWFKKMLSSHLRPISNLYFFKQRLHFDKNIVQIRSRVLRNIYKGLLAIFLFFRHPKLIFKLFW